MGGLNSEEPQPYYLSLSECLSAYFQKNNSIFGPDKNNFNSFIFSWSLPLPHVHGPLFSGLLKIQLLELSGKKMRLILFVIIFAKIWIVLLYFHFGTFLRSVEYKLNLLIDIVCVYVSCKQLKMSSIHKSLCLLFYNSPVPPVISCGAFMFVFEKSYKAQIILLCASMHFHNFLLHTQKIKHDIRSVYAELDQLSL